MKKKKFFFDSFKKSFKTIMKIIKRPIFKGKLGIVIVNLVVSKTSTFLKDEKNIGQSNSNTKNVV
jgi:hypothetical protein